MSRRTPTVYTLDGQPITAAKAHPAQYSPEHVALFSQLLAVARHGWDLAPGEPPRVLDRMGGVGGIHRLDPTNYHTICCELEPAFVHIARQLWPDRDTRQDDATEPWRDAPVHAYFVSPTFGNRYADHHRNLDAHRPCEGKGCAGCWGSGISLRRSYTHDARRIAGPDYELHEHNTGLLLAGSEAYQRLHELAWLRALEALVPGGLMAVDVKDHTRNKRPVEVVALHRAILAEVGFEPVTETTVTADGMRNGANREAREATHTVIVCRKPAAEAEVAA